jgi:hypothetical protein
MVRMKNSENCGKKARTMLRRRIGAEVQKHHHVIVSRHKRMKAVLLLCKE